MFREIERDAANRVLMRQDEGCAHVRMAGKRHLGARREYTDTSRVRRIVRRQDKRCLGKVELVGDGLHLSVRKAARIRNHRHGVAAELPVGEDIDRLKWRLHFASSLPISRRTLRRPLSGLEWLSNSNGGSRRLLSFAPRAGSAARRRDWTDRERPQQVPAGEARMSAAGACPRAECADNSVLPRRDFTGALHGRRRPDTACAVRRGLAGVPLSRARAGAPADHGRTA